MISFIRAINFAAAFFLELAMIVSFGYFGYQYPENTILKYCLLIILPLAATTLWGFFAAPKSKHRLPKIQRVVFALALFGTSIFLLNATGRTMLAEIFAVLVVSNQVLLFILEE